MRYLGREAVTRDIGSGRFYNAKRDDLYAKEESRTWAQDRRHFRLIVSPDGAPSLGDMKPYIREVMVRIERDLGPVESLLGNDWFCPTAIQSYSKRCPEPTPRTPPGWPISLTDARRLAGAMLLSTLIALDGNYAASIDPEKKQLAIVGETVAQDSARVEQRLIDRKLDLRPTITVRQGMPCNVLVTKDLELARYQPVISRR